MKKSPITYTLPQVLTDPTSTTSEQYRTVTTNISFLMQDDGLKTLIITSPDAGAGKSTTLANIATSLASQGKKVLCVDTDLRKPTLHKHFQLENRFGVTNHLVQGTALESCLQTVSKIPNLTVMTAGAIPPNPYELINSKGMIQLIHTLKQNYDIVLFDTPPTLAVGDAKSLSTQTDAVALIARFNQTKKADIDLSYQELKQVKANIIGTVLNGMPKSQHTGYYYGL